MTRWVGIILAVIVLGAMTVRLGLVLSSVIGASPWGLLALIPVLLLAVVIVRLIAGP